MRALLLVLLAAITGLLSGCEAIGHIFEAGVWVGVIGIIVVVALIGLLVSVLRR
jgi:hypothetical protein